MLEAKRVVKRFGATTSSCAGSISRSRRTRSSPSSAPPAGQVDLRCANLLERVDDGQILLGGEDITDPRVDADTVRARIGVVFQHYNLFPHMSVLATSRSPRGSCIVGTPIAPRPGHGVLERIGLAAKAHEYPDRLSGGQQQRVAIVRRHDEPELLLLDEITLPSTPSSAEEGP